MPPVGSYAPPGLGNSPGRFPTTFVLGYRLCAGMLHLYHPGRPVGAHSGQDHADRVASRGFGDRLEHHIHRRPLVADARAVFRAGRAIEGATRTGERAALAHG